MANKILLSKVTSDANEKRSRWDLAAKRLSRNGNQLHVIVMNSFLYEYFGDLSEQNLILSEQFQFLSTMGDYLGISSRGTKAKTITSCDNAFVTNIGAVAVASLSRKKHLLARAPGAKRIIGRPHVMMLKGKIAN
ncbi:hypothetical protein [Lysinibacillus sp. NPDC059133]|uniref:hypothetical protein n=1 Tax=Lysinibacillus sp. NPDC059133 TaxID=3346737 RepID=UPI00367391BA